MKRRRILRSVGGGAGIAGTGLTLFRDASSYRHVDTHKSGDEVVRRERVSSDWWEHVQQARHYRDIISEKYLGSEGIRSVGITQGCAEVGDRKRMEISVGVESRRYGNDLPAEIHGISVTKRTVPDRKLMTQCENAGDYSDMPGGVEIHDPEGAATSTCAVKDTNKDEVRMLTADHLFYTGDCKDTSETRVYQDGTVLGDVRKHDLDLDYAFVDLSLNDTYEYQNKVLDSSLDSRVSVDGYVSPNGVCVMMCNDACTNSDCSKEDIRKEGIALGSLTGEYITEIDHQNDSCPTYEGEGIVTTFDIAGGDSGGPMYDYRDDNAYILAINSGATEEQKRQQSCTNDDGEEVKIYPYGGASGPSAYSIYNDTSMKFAY